MMEKARLRQPDGGSEGIDLLGLGCNQGVEGLHELLLLTTSIEHLSMV